MPFAMPRLVDVLSARYTQTGGLELHIIVTDYLGNPDAVTIPYTRDVTEERLPDGSLYMLGLEIDSWLLSHPDFVIQPYEAPEPTPEMTPAEKFAAATGLSIEDLRALVKE